MSWQPINQQDTHIEELGSKLSLKINCPVRLEYWNSHRGGFECSCGTSFALFIVEGAELTNDWSTVLQRHLDGNG